MKDCSMEHGPNTLLNEPTRDCIATISNKGKRCGLTSYDEQTTNSPTKK